MSDRIAIQFDHVGKLYRLGLVGTGTLSHDLNRWWQTKFLRHEDPYLKVGETNDRAHKGKSDYVWALKDITFDVKEGEVVGIIGKNGAGKSTFLKLLSRVTSPTTGTIRARGKIASLLEVGTGFHREMTGRENIFMNGSILGMTRSEINARLDEIIEFAGIERYIDTPVKRYSSGMTVRLGFSVASFLEPDILVVDEVLAVGDAEFRKKALGKMREVSQCQGRTVLFVSHNMKAVKNLCSRGVVLDNGMITFDGDIDDAVSRYIQFANESNSKPIIKNIRWTKSFLHIDRIEFNGVESDFSVVRSGQRVLPVVIEGSVDVDLNTGLVIIFKNTYDTPLASLEEGEYKGEPLCLKKGAFRVEKKILLPEYIGRGKVTVDILFKLSSEFHMEARQCVTLGVEGGADIFGKPLIMNQRGFLGLETED